LSAIDHIDIATENLMANIMLCVLAGGTAGWIAYALLKVNKERGVVISVIIGMLGGFVGGSFLASMFGAGASIDPGDFNPFRLFVACASAAAFLIISSMVQKRFGI
jgi:uncharacterized membrane protein YeaQ/YmgE (transglycosylase-associated protein family)